MAWKGVTRLTIDPKLLGHLGAFDTPAICDALEIIAPECRAEGFTTRPFVCAFPSLAPMVGFARTATIRAATPPTLSAAELKAQRLAYYRYMAEESGPRVAVIQDLDPEPGCGAFWGEVNTAVHKGLGVLGCITNGAMRDLDMVATGFQLLAGGVAPSRAGVRIESFVTEVTVHGMRIRHGDLVHADRHGAVVIPLDLAEKLPWAIELCARREALVVAAARQPGFGVEQLEAALAEAENLQ
jgi:regulator of RNase E activity RraA